MYKLAFWSVFCTKMAASLVHVTCPGPFHVPISIDLWHAFRKEPMERASGQNQHPDADLLAVPDLTKTDTCVIFLCTGSCQAGLEGRHVSVWDTRI